MHINGPSLTRSYQNLRIQSALASLCIDLLKTEFNRFHTSLHYNDTTAPCSPCALVPSPCFIWSIEGPLIHPVAIPIDTYEGKMSSEDTEPQGTSQSRSIFALVSSHSLQRIGIVVQSQNRYPTPFGDWDNVTCAMRTYSSLFTLQHVIRDKRC